MFCLVKDQQKTQPVVPLSTCVCQRLLELVKPDVKCYTTAAKFLALARDGVVPLLTAAEPIGFPLAKLNSCRSATEPATLSHSWHELSRTAGWTDRQMCDSW